LHRLDRSTGPGSGRSRRHHKMSRAYLYCPKEMQSVPEREDTQRACSPIGPHGRTGTMPRMRRGDFDPTDRAYERARRRAPHVRVQAMPRATSIHRRSRERNYSCDAPLAGRSPTAPPAIEPLGGEPRLPTGRGSLSEPPVCGGATREIQSRGSQPAGTCCGTLKGRWIVSAQTSMRG
jgi:hypothetical protein